MIKYGKLFLGMFMKLATALAKTETTVEISLT